jgi:hypothetical protein
MARVDLNRAINTGVIKMGYQAKSIFQVDHKGRANIKNRNGGTVTPQCPEGSRVITKGFPAAPKRHAPMAIHGGMQHTGKDGSMIAGISATQIARAPDASGRDPLEPDYTVYIKKKARR